MSKPMTGSDYIKLRDYPVAVNPDGSINEESQKQMQAIKDADLKLAIEFDIRTYNRLTR